MVLRRSLLLLSVPLLLLAAPRVQAQTVSCAGVAAYSPTTLYQPGAQVTYVGNLYRANVTIANAPPSYCPSCGWWTLLGTCGSSTDTTAPSVPGGLAASAVTSTSLTLSWTASTDAGGSGLAGYDVYRNGALITSPTTPSAAVTGLTASTTYSFTVRARDGAGNASAQSAALSVTTSGAAACSVLPAAPAAPTASAITSTSVTLTWTAPSAGTGCTIAGYTIFQNGATAATTTGTGTSAAVAGLAASTTYSFTVAARNAFGTGPQSPARSVTTSPSGATSRVAMAYFAQWGIYARSYFPKNIETSGSAAKLNIVNYAFGNVVGNRCSVGVTALGVGDAYADYQKAYDAATSVDGVADNWTTDLLKGNWNQLRKLKARHPGLKVVISLGGWTWSDGLYTAAQPANRVAFVSSCVDAYIRGNLPFDAGSNSGGAGVAAGVFDGIDVDWEYPGVCGNNPACGASSADKANMVALFQEFRRQLDAVRPGLLLTAAVAAGEDKIANYDVPGIAASLNYVNIMSYDFFGAWSAAGPTAFHAPLYAWTGMPTTPPLNHYYADYAVQLWKSRGAPASKLLLGVPFYGRGWSGVTNANNGLNQTASSAAPGTYEAGVDDYKVLVTRGYPAFTSSEAGTAWIFNGSTFWSYDTPATIATKMAYVRAQGLGGAFAWELDGDTASGTLMTALKGGL